MVDKGLPAWVWLPVLVATVAGILWQTRATWLVYLGFQEVDGGAGER